MKNSIILLLISCIIMGNHPSFGQLPKGKTKEEKKRRIVTLSGGLTFGSQIYKTYGIDRSYDNTDLWNIHGSANVNIYNQLSLPFSFTLGRYGLRGTYPIFKQVGVSPSYKWLRVHLGWRSIQMSKYTLSGNTFLGAGVEMHPGIFRFAAMYGRFQKAMVVNDSLDNVGIRVPTYSRKGYAMKVGIGSDQTFFDVIYFKGKDDPNSLDRLTTDSLPAAAENAVLGFNMKWKINRRIYFFGEGATSVFTRDVSSQPLVDKSLDIAKNVLTPRTSTRINYAYNAGLNLIYPFGQLRLKYERIMPEFESMGTYYLKDDEERISIAPSFSLLENRLQVNTTLGLQRNNLLNVKKETTKNILAHGNVTFQLNEIFGINMNFSTFDLRQEDGNTAINDTFRVAQVNSNLSISPYWVWTKDSTLEQNVNVSLNYQTLNDRSPFTKEFTDMTTWFANTNYSRSWLTTGLSLNVGANYNYIILANLSNVRYGATIGVNKQTKDEKWNVSFSSTFNLSSINGTSDGNVISSNVGLSYNITKKAVLSFNTNYLINHSKQYDDYKEIIANLNLSYTF